MIRVRELSHIFDKRGIAGLHTITFSLSSGQVLGVMGPNGSGKSTLLNILAGKISHQQGSILLEGEASLFPEKLDLDLHQNVLRFLVNSVSDEINEEKKVQLARDLADIFEFSFQLRQTLADLSSGQMQKVLLAAKLIDRPKVLLLDEPFAHLDPFTRGDILRSLFAFIRLQEISIVWVTHDLEDALRFSDNILILNFGRIEQFSSPLELIKHPKNLYVAQFLGYRNFFPVLFTNGHWESPWGDLPFPKRDWAGALLVVPNSSWEMSEKGVEFKILRRYPVRQFIEYELEYGTQKVYFVRSPEFPILDETTMLSLRPNLRQSFLIPL
jgi:ABC-type sulfate/molybdate transport systems ATPase subunit